MDTSTNQSDTGTNAGSTLDHKAGCATMFQPGKFDRNCPRCSKIEKVIYLRRKTIENGCTQDEMVSAVKLAQSLADKYLLVDAELIDRAFAPDVKAAEKAAQEKVRAERAKRAQEAADAAKQDALRKATEKAAREAASAKLDALREKMEQSERASQWARAEYQNARKDSGMSDRASSKSSARKSASQSSCNGDAVTCACRSHAAKRAWNTMRANGNGYAYGHKVA